MRIAIFGGSFNPPHVGHLKAAGKAVSEIAADKLLIIPTSKPPHKEKAACSPDAYDRLRLTKLAFKPLQNAEISDVELSRGGTSYSVETLEALRASHPGDELFLLIGTDMLLSFETWKNFERILELATLAVFPRGSNEDEVIAQMSQKLQREYNAKIITIPLKPVDISSTELRLQLKQRGGDELLPEPVYAEIIKHRYYGAKPNLEWLRKKAFLHLEEKRIPHVLGCEQEAVRLAQRWGANPGLAAEAGILHDITKKLDRSEQLKLCMNYGIMTDNDEIKNAKLLHSKTGAALARDMFGVSDEVYGAIFWHTTARENMTLLEKILYIADYIEPNREFDGVSELRLLAYENLDKAIYRGLEMSLRELSAHNIIPHENSVRACEWLKRIIIN